MQFLTLKMSGMKHQSFHGLILPIWLFHQLLNNVCVCGKCFLLSIMSTDPAGRQQLEQPQAAGFGLPGSFVIRGFCSLLLLPKETVQESVSDSKKPTWNLDLWLEDNLRIDLSLFISLDANLPPTEIQATGSVSLALLVYAGWVANWTDGK